MVYDVVLHHKDKYGLASEMKGSFYSNEDAAMMDLIRIINRHFDGITISINKQEGEKDNAVEL